MGNMFRCTLKSGGASGTGIPLIVICDQNFAGKTITATNGTTTLTETCPSASPYTVQFDLPNTGTWTISGVVEGVTYTENINVTEYQLSLETGFNYATWVSRGGLDPSDYASLSDVFADEEATRRLMLVHASADYLIDKVSNDITTIDDFCANDTAMKWLGLCDYVCDGLTAITGVEAKLLASTYWERYLKDHVPVMTSNTAPYGEAISSGLVGTGYANWKAFNRTTANDDDGWAGNNANSWIGYAFPTPICVKAITIKNKKSSTPIPIKDFILQGSNDKTTWNDIQNYTNTGTESEASTTFQVTNNAYYLYNRIFVVNSYGSYACIGELQFYGRALNVSVPVMTSDTLPYGQAIYSTEYTNDFSAFKAFDGTSITDNTKAGWVPAASDSFGSAYVGYDFGRQIKLGMFSVGFVKGSTTVTGYHFKIQGSNDATSWSDITDNTALPALNAWYSYAASGLNRYYRLVPLSNSTSAITAGRGYKIQFYGVDYSEKEFEAGTTKKWLYDNGVELETMAPYTYGTNSIAQKNNDNLHVEVPASSQRQANFMVSLDLTSYNLYRAVYGDVIATGQGSSACSLAVFSSDPTGYNPSGNVAKTTVVPPDSNLPNNISLDISAVIGTNYIGIFTANNTDTVNKKGEVKELWLE